MKLARTAAVGIAITVLLSPEVLAITRGEVADRQAAVDVSSCAHQYLGQSNSGPNTEIWIMCLHASSELARRDKIDVARRVIENIGYNVFEIEVAPGWFSGGDNKTLSPALIDRVHRGD
jgi:hypothetical protein